MSLAPASASAQLGGRVSVYAFDGGLAPLRDRVNAPGIILEERFAPLFGAGLTWWSRGRLGVEGILAIAPSTARTTGTSAYALTANGKSTFAGASFLRLLVAVSPPDLPVVLFANGGVGTVLHWGGAYEGVTGRLDLSGIGGLGVRLRLGRCVYGRAEVDDWFYSAGFGTEPAFAGTTARWQHDLMLSAGVELLLGNP